MLETDGVCTGFFKVNVSADFTCGFSGKTKYAAHRFVSSGFLCGESCGLVEAGMMISEVVSHFFHIKVTVGNIRADLAGGGVCAEFPLQNTGLFGFCICIRSLEFPSPEQESS